MKARIRKKIEIAPVWREELFFEDWIPDDATGDWIPKDDNIDFWKSGMQYHRCQACKILFSSIKTRDRLCEECRYRGLWRAQEILEEIRKETMDWHEQWERAEAKLQCRYCGWEDRRKQPKSEAEFLEILPQWASRLEQHKNRHQRALLRQQVLGKNIAHVE
jgi:hypothetical protein